MKQFVIMLMVFIPILSFAPNNSFYLYKESDFIYEVSIIAHIESRYKLDAFNESENAVGLLQIRQTVIDDVNKFFNKNYTINEMYNPFVAVTVLNLYREMYRVPLKELHLLWNGGPGYKSKKLSKYKSTYKTSRSNVVQQKEIREREAGQKG